MVVLIINSVKCGVEATAMSGYKLKVYIILPEKISILHSNLNLVSLENDNK